MRIYFYIRLSSADDDLKYKNESDSVANQRSLLQQYIESRREFYGCEIEEFVDDGFTGTNDERPSFNRMIEHLKNGDAQLVICKDFSRFFRDYTEIGDYLERIFPFLGVRFISVNDGYDSDDYKGTTAGMEVVMKYIIYSFYSRDLSQKTKAAMEIRMKNGEYIYPFPPFGYMLDPEKKHHLLPDPETAPVVRKVFDWALAGYGTGDIARKLNDEEVETPSKYFRRKKPDNGRYSNTSSKQCWDRDMVWVILQRFEYTGACVFKKKMWKGIDNPRTKSLDKDQHLIVPDCHEAIISTEEYDRAQAVIKKNRKKGEEVYHDYLLRSLVKCGVCGRAMRRQSCSKRVYYSCTSARNSPNPECPVNERFYEDDLEAAVTKNLKVMLGLLVEHKKMVDTAASKSKGTKANLRQSLLRVEKSIKQNKLSREDSYERYSDGEISRDAFMAIKDRLQVELTQLSDEKTQIEKELADHEASENQELTTLGKEAERVLQAKEVTNQMLRFFVDRVDVYSGMMIEIKYRISDELMSNLIDTEEWNGETEV